MKHFIYKDIGQHGPSHKPAFKQKPDVEGKSPQMKPAGKLHKKRSLKSRTLVRSL